MLVTFKTKAYADITMFGDVAATLLKMMGHSVTIPGAVLAVDVPLALSRLTSAIALEKALPVIEDKDADETVVSLAQRSVSLLNLLKAAGAADCDVMWE